MDFNLFCYVCKKSIPISAENEKDAMQKFTTSGHDGVKTKTLRRGPVGK